MEVEKPAGYSPRAYQNLLGRARTDHTEGLGEQNPHIIAIMNESWADFEEFGNLSLNDSVMDEIRSLNGIFGHAYTSVFGAGTSASEFEFLTGNTMAFLPSGSIPYQQYVLESTDSLASLLKEKGYRCLALHPGERDSWQRNRRIRCWVLRNFFVRTIWRFRLQRSMDISAMLLPLTSLNVCLRNAGQERGCSFLM